MSQQNWDTPYWPEGVAHQIEDYKFPLFKLLDRAAEKYPDNVFTIFADGKKTYAQAKDTADRISSFLVSKGIKKRGKGGDLPAQPAPVSRDIVRHPESGCGICKLQPDLYAQ
jgi:hypothetical protein